MTVSCAARTAATNAPSSEAVIVITGTAGIGKSTLCARLAGTIPGAILLDADIHAEDLVSIAPPSHDYPASWRSMMRLAHEIAQNDVVVVYFSTMLPEQILVNGDALGYFDSVHFLCLTCPSEVVRSRLRGRVEAGPVSADIEAWVDFNHELVSAAYSLSTSTILDASRAVDQVEHDVRSWIDSRLPRPDRLTTGSAVRGENGNG